LETIKRKRRRIEGGKQKACVRWFRYQYPQFAKLLFHVPNGGGRNKIEAKLLQDEGVTPGVSDLILLVPCKGYASLCIEMKSETGKQSPDQKEWQQECERVGNKYVLANDIEVFIKEINNYLL